MEKEEKKEHTHIMLNMEKKVAALGKEKQGKEG